MSLHRRAAKRDAAEPEIVKTLEAHGCIVWRLSGKGLADLVVFYRRRIGVKSMDSTRHTFVADVKGPKEKATPAQEEKWGALTALGFSVFILRTPEDAVKMLNNALHAWEPAPWCQTPGCIHRGPCPEARPLSTPLPGGHVKRHRCGKNGCRRLRPCVTHDDTETQRRLMAGYTPPRSKPVDAARPKAGDAANAREAARIRMAMDAAKEAEETFAPVASVAGDCGCRREQPCALHSHYVGAGEI